MKNPFKKAPQNDGGVITNIVDKELTTYIQQKHVEFVPKHQKTAQQLSVMKFSELPKNASIRDYISGITLDYQDPVNFTNHRLNGKLHEARGSNDISDMKVEMTQLGEDISEVDDKLAIVNATFDDTAKKHKATLRSWQKVLWILYFLAAFELLANTQVYSLLGGGILASVSIAIITGIIVFYWAHLTVKIVNRFGGTQWWRQLLVFLVMAIPIGVIFSLFSSMRIEYLQMLNPEMSHVFASNPIVPTLVNFFAYLIATYLVFEYRPKKEVKNAYKKYGEDCKEIDRLKTERKALVTKKNTLEPKLRQRLLEYKNILLLGQQSEQDIQTKMHACFYEFKSKLFLLSNGKCASLFTGDINKDVPPLQFNYQDIDDKIKDI